MGIFHQFDEEIQDSIMAMAMATRIANRESKRRQELAKLLSEEGVRAKALAKADKKNDVISKYHGMHLSPAYISGDPGLVDQIVERNRLVKDQREALVNNIKIRVEGFGWKDFQFTYTRDGKPKKIEELVEHLKKIIVEEKDEKYVIPAQPPLITMLRKPAPIIGTITDGMRVLNENCMHDEETRRDVVLRLSRERKARGEAYSYYETYQPAFRPTLEELVEGTKRIDVLWAIDDEDEDGNVVSTDYQWCQGKVVGLVSKEEHEVLVMWDGMPDIKGWEKGSETPDAVELHPNKWRSRKEMGWRLDVDVELFDNYYRDTDILVDQDALEEDDKDCDECKNDGEEDGEDNDDGNDLTEMYGDSSDSDDDGVLNDENIDSE